MISMDLSARLVSVWRERVCEYLLRQDGSPDPMLVHFDVWSYGESRGTDQIVRRSNFSLSPSDLDSRSSLYL